MSCLMCGGDVGCPKTYGKNLKAVGEGMMSGEGFTRFVRKTAGKKNLKKVA